MKWYLCWLTQESNRENQIFQQQKIKKILDILQNIWKDWNIYLY